MRLTKSIVFMGLCVLLTAVGLLSCDEYCDQGTTSAMVLKLCADDGMDTPLMLTDDNCAVVGVGEIADSTRLTFYPKTATWLLPLSNKSDTTLYMIQVKDSPVYGITVVASRKAKFISDVCGCANVGNISGVSVIPLTEPSGPDSTACVIRRIVLNDPEVRVLTYSEDYRYVTNLTVYF